jgi:hypothetical protein
VPQLQPVGEQERSKCAIGLPWALVRKHRLPAAGLVPMVENGKCGDGGDTCLLDLVLDPIVMAHTFAELEKGTMARERDNRFRSGRNLGHTLYCQSK